MNQNFLKHLKYEIFIITWPPPTPTESPLQSIWALPKWTWGGHGAVNLMYSPQAWLLGLYAENNIYNSLIQAQMSRFQFPKQANLSHFEKWFYIFLCDILACNFGEFWVVIISIQAQKSHFQYDGHTQKGDTIFSEFWLFFFYMNLLL